MVDCWDGYEVAYLEILEVDLTEYFEVFGTAVMKAYRLDE